MSTSAVNAKNSLSGDGSFGDCEGSATVSSQLHTVQTTYESHHTKGEPWNSFMKTAAPTFHKRAHPLPPLNIMLLQLSLLIFY